MESFKEAGLPQPLFHRLEQMEYLIPTPIQAQAIPAAMEGKDVLGSAQTGTGKTAAYGIPLITQLMTSSRGSGLILLPTRELAAQVMQELKKFIGSSKIKTALLIGGEPMPKQVQQLRMRPKLIVGTPGRINDHLKRGTLMLHDTNYLVLDEADRMLDMGFGIQLDEIKRYLTGKRQTLLFSATLPDNIKKLAGKYLTDPIRISVGETHAVAAKVKQENIKLQESEKFDRLVEELYARKGSVIVFVKTKHGADRMAGKLQKLGHKVDALHGDLRQSKRNRVTAAFRNQDFRILIATDVAARGLDIPHIEHVINYDLPQSPEDYIHRIGRTARAGAEGHAVNFLTSADRIKWNAISHLIDPDGTPEDLGGGGGRGNSNRGKFKGKHRNGGGRNYGKKKGGSSFNNRNNKNRNKNTQSIKKAA
jgi:superfamily II DNA/RNA helicase